MKAAVLFAGPRLKHHTDTLLEHVLKGVASSGYTIERYNLKSMNIQPCSGCYGCERHGDCVLKDDMQMLYNIFDEADLIIFASPVFFNSVTAIGKAMIDRCQMYWTRRFKLNREKTRKKKLGIFVSTMGTKQRADEFKGSSLVIDIFFKAIDATLLQTVLAENTDDEPVAGRIQYLTEVEDRMRSVLMEAVTSVVRAD